MPKKKRADNDPQMPNVAAPSVTSAAGQRLTLVGKRPPPATVPQGIASLLGGPAQAIYFGTVAAAGNEKWAGSDVAWPGLFLFQFNQTLDLAAKRLDELTREFARAGWRDAGFEERKRARIVVEDLKGWVMQCAIAASAVVAAAPERESLAVPSDVRERARELERIGFSLATVWHETANALQSVPGARLIAESVPRHRIVAIALDEDGPPSSIPPGTLLRVGDRTLVPAFETDLPKDHSTAPVASLADRIGAIVEHNAGGVWIRVRAASTSEGITSATLSNYRQAGDRTDDGLQGIDTKGRLWRKASANAQSEYFRPTLLSSRPKPTQ